MPVEFLSDEEVAAYGGFVGSPSRTELARWCLLDDADLRLVNRRRVDHLRLGCALQLVTVRALGLFLVDPLDVPTVVLDEVAGQLGVTDASCVKRYTERRPTLSLFAVVDGDPQPPRGRVHALFADLDEQQQLLNSLLAVRPEQDQAGVETARALLSCLDRLSVEIATVAGEPDLYVDTDLIAPGGD